MCSIPLKKEKKEFPEKFLKIDFPLQQMSRHIGPRPKITLVLVRTIKSHQASIHQRAMAFDYYDITGGDDYMWWSKA